MLTSMAQSAFSTWLLSSNSIWAYPTVLTLHTFGMMVLVGAALMIDLRLLGFAQAIPLQSMDRLFGIVWAAFALNALTPAVAAAPFAILAIVSTSRQVSAKADQAQGRTSPASRFVRFPLYIASSSPKLCLAQRPIVPLPLLRRKTNARQDRFN